MGNVRVSEVTTAISEHIGNAEINGLHIFKQTQTGKSLTEGIPETAIAQIYFESRKTSNNSATDRRSFSGHYQPIRQHVYTIHVDVFARQRSNIGTDMVAVTDAIDAVDDVLEKQLNSPFFGIDGAKSFSYNVERLTFEVAGNKYAGVRFIVLLTIL